METARPGSDARWRLLSTAIVASMFGLPAWAADGARKSGGARAATVAANANVASPASADQNAGSGDESPHEPSADDLINESIFGFSDSTDVGDPGEKGVGTEHDGRLKKRDGRYFALASKYFVAYTFAPEWSIAVSGFTARHLIKDVTALSADVNGFAFDGGSVELSRRLIQRSPGNPFALTLAFEPRWARTDGLGGLRATS